MGGYSGTGNRKGRKHAWPPYTTAPPPDSTQHSPGWRCCPCPGGTTIPARNHSLCKVKCTADAVERLRGLRNWNGRTRRRTSHAHPP